MARLHIDWSKRRDDHTKKAIDCALHYDFPLIVLVIYYPDMAAHMQPPSHYIIELNEVRPATRRQATQATGLKILYMPDCTIQAVWQ